MTTNWLRTIDGANLGLTLMSTLLSVAVLLYATPSIGFLIRHRRLPSSWVMCAVGAQIAAGSLSFSARRVLLFSTGSGLIIAQPLWSKLAVLTGCLFFYSALVTTVVWRAEKTAKRGGLVAAVLGALSVFCMAGGAYVVR